MSQLYRDSLQSIMLSIIYILTLFVSVLCASDAASQPAVTKEAATSKSVKQVDIEFLTKLVSDVRSHFRQYGAFRVTNDDNIPAIFTTLAYQLISYTDDSYTTLLRNADFDITTLEQFATKLGWYDERLSISGLNPKTLKDTNDARHLVPGLLNIGAVSLGFSLLGLF